MDRSLVASYADLAEHHWWWRARRAVLAAELERLARRRPFPRILEVGCASGANLPLFADYGEVRALEPDAALRGKDSRILARPLDATYEPDRPFDLVAALDVLEHVQDRATFLAQARRVLSPEGCLLVTVPAHRWLWTRHDEANQHLLRYSKSALRNELETAGFQVSRARLFFPSLVPAKLAVRLVEALKRKKPSEPPRVPAAPWNNLAAGWLRVEDRLLGPLHLPIGSSLLALASPPNAVRGRK